MEHCARDSGPRPTGSLVIVGTGIQLISDMTLGAKAWIERADKVLFAVAEPAAAEWLRELNPTAEALPYDTSRSLRRAAYALMADRILAEVRRGLLVCAVFYGHPGVFVRPAHEALERARREGFPVQMLPGVSAEDRLFADLGVDPASAGCQSFEATDFLLHARRFDPCSALVLWQIATIGNLGFDLERGGGPARGLSILAEALEPHYGPLHEVYVYEAALYPTCKPASHVVPLGELPSAIVTKLSTLYVPPRGRAAIDTAMLARLGMSEPGEPAPIRAGEDAAGHA